MKELGQKVGCKNAISNIYPRNIYSFSYICKLNVPQIVEKVVAKKKKI